MTKNVLIDYFTKNGLVKHQIDSYNNFINYEIQKIIDDVGNVVFNKANDVYKIEFKEISLSNVTHVESTSQQFKILPHESRLRNVSYCGNLFVNVEIIKNEECIEKKHCELGKIPVMVKSNYCNLHNNVDSRECAHDYGGYFIISGNEKVLISQEKMNNNQVYVFEKKVGQKTEWEAEIRSIAEGDTKSTSTIKLCVYNVSEGEYKLMIQLPFLKTDIPAFAVFNMLGETYEDYVNEYDNYIADDLIMYSKQNLETELHGTTIEAYVEKKLATKDKVLEVIIEKYMLPHMETKRNKCHMFGYMINKLI